MKTITRNSMTMHNHIFRGILTNSFFSKGIICLMALLFTFSCGRRNSDGYTVMTGPFRQSVTEAGELQAIKASAIMISSIGYQFGSSFKIVGLTEHGKSVHKGDSIIMLDPSSVYKYILDAEDKLELEVAASNKQAVQSENNIQELQAQLKSEQAAYDLKKLAVERLNFESDVKKKIADLEFQQATIRLNKVKRNLELKPKLNDYDQHIQQIKVKQRENDVQAARETLKKLLIRAPIDGIFQVGHKSYWDQSSPLLKIGDSPYIGYPVASIPDLKKMKANTYINEVDINKVRPGLKVLVRLDALPSVTFNGVITSIDKVCTERNNEKVFNAEVEIAETDMRLKPGMTVNCEFILYESDKDTFVPNDCLLKEKGHSYIFLKRGSSFRKIEVKAVCSNSNHTIVKADIKPGQKLIPFEKVLTSSN
jgi:HlyD family secretion protein